MIAWTHDYYIEKQTFSLNKILLCESDENFLSLNDNKKVRKYFIKNKENVCFA